MTNQSICCFTGHRAIPTNELSPLANRLRETISQLASDGILTFRAGGAMGFDTLAAMSVLELRDKLGLRLELILPCHNQTRGWPERDVRYYRYILEHCDSYRYISDVYTRTCMLERNRQLVDGSSVCVAYCKHSHGGTAYTVACAMRHGVRIIML